MNDSRKTAAFAASVAAAPFLIGRVLPVSSPSSWPVLCPFRATTGLPCPLCGATRSVVLAAHGDAAFLNYNPVWVAALLTIVLVGATIALLGPRLPQLRSSRLWGAAGVVLLAVGWVVSLAHRDTITSTA